MDQQAVRSLPKVELHCHLCGSVSKETLEKIIRREAPHIPETELPALLDITAPEDCTSLKDYLRVFPKIMDWLQTEWALEQTALDVVSQAAAENVRHIEIRFAPMYHCRQGLSYSAIISAVLRGLQRGSDIHGVSTGLILCFMRGESPEHNRLTLEAAAQFLGHGVVAVDLAGSERDDPPSGYRPLFRRAREIGLACTVHAGENGPPDYIAQAIEMGATRIGHGIAAKDSPEIRTICVENNILLEMCPVSNLQTKAAPSLADYPLPLFNRENVPVCINTDNRTVSGTSLCREFLLLEALGMDYAQMKALTLNAVSGSFLPLGHKEALQAEIEEAYNQRVPLGAPSAESACAPIKQE